MVLIPSGMFGCGENVSDQEGHSEWNLVGRILLRYVHTERLANYPWNPHQKRLGQKPRGLLQPAALAGGRHPGIYREPRRGPAVPKRRTRSSPALRPARERATFAPARGQRSQTPRTRQSLWWSQDGTSSLIRIRNPLRSRHQMTHLESWRWRRLATTKSRQNSESVWVPRFVPPSATQVPVTPWKQ